MTTPITPLPRTPAAQDQADAKATLGWDDHEAPVRLVNESGGSFAVICPDRLAPVARQDCRLHTAAGSFDVRVSRTEIFLNGMVVGLLKRCDEVVPKERWLRFLAWWQRRFTPAEVSRQA